MTYSQKLRELFPEISLSWEDLLLLEAFQIKYLPDRVPANAFATLIRSYPVLHRFLIAKYPPIATFLSGILKEIAPGLKQEQMEEHCQEALWEIADLIIFNKDPERFDAQAPIRWEISEISSLSSLEGKAVADVGAGSGRIAFLVAPHAKTVYAVEPLASFRTFMKEKAAENRMNNVFVLDGTLDSIPLPDQFLDILLTSNAIGWNLSGELPEIERVLKPGGHAIHLLQAEEKDVDPFHDILTSSTWNYTCLQETGRERIKRRYYKRK